MSEEKKFAPSIEVSSVVAPDIAPLSERGGERVESSSVKERPDDSVRVAEQTARAAAAAVALNRAPSRASQDPVYAEVEHVLEEGLMPYYQTMNPKVQQLFKTRGEELANTLTDMVKGAKIQLAKAVELIRRWLMLIPGVNRFFLEQEAKIRADRIAMIAELSAERKRQSQ